MKTYEEMAQSVIRRAKAHKAARNRLIAGSVAAVLVLGLCLGVMAKNQLTDEPTLQTPPITGEPDKTNYRVTFLSAEGENTIKMEDGVTIPMNSQLRVQDVTGMTQDEIKAVVKAEKDYAEHLIAAYPDAKGPGWEQFENDRLVVTYISAGCVVLKTEDVSQIESIRATTKNSTITIPAFTSQQRDAVADDPEAYYGFYNRYPMTQDYLITGSALTGWYYIPYGGIQVNLGLGDGVAKYLSENQVPLSQLSETLTFAVTYVDGTVETHTIDMIFNENGEIFATYRGADATV